MLLASVYALFLMYTAWFFFCRISNSMLFRSFFGTGTFFTMILFPFSGSGDSLFIYASVGYICAELGYLDQVWSKPLLFLLSRLKCFYVLSITHSARCFSVLKVTNFQYFSASSNAQNVLPNALSMTCPDFLSVIHPLSSVFLFNVLGCTLQGAVARIQNGGAVQNVHCFTVPSCRWEVRVCNIERRSCSDRMSSCAWQ